MALSSPSHSWGDWGTGSTSDPPTSHSQEDSSCLWQNPILLQPCGTASGMGSVCVCVCVCLRTEEVGRKAQTELMAKSAADFLGGHRERWAHLALPPHSGLDGEPGLWEFCRKETPSLKALCPRLGGRTGSRKVEMCWVETWGLFVAWC